MFDSRLPKRDYLLGITPTFQMRYNEIIDTF